MGRYLWTISSFLLTTPDSAPLTLNAKLQSSGNKHLLHFLKLFVPSSSNHVASQKPPFSTRTTAQLTAAARWIRVQHGQLRRCQRETSTGFPNTHWNQPSPSRAAVEQPPPPAPALSPAMLTRRLCPILPRFNTPSNLALRHL